MFRSECRRRKLRCCERKVHPGTEPSQHPDRDDSFGGGGVMGRQCDYEGGFLLMAIDREDAPYTEWHREDFKPHEDVLKIIK